MMICHTPPADAEHPSQYSSFRQGLARAATAALVCLVSAMAGCPSVSREEYILNPDGTGKVHLACVQQAGSKMQLSWDEPSEKDKVWSHVEKILTESEGIEAWRDARYGVRQIEDQKYVLFEGTAYFRELKRLKLPGESRAVKADWQVADDGTGVLLVIPGKDEDDEDEADNRDASAGTDEDVGPPAEAPEHPLFDRIAEANSRQGIRMMQAMLEGRYQEMSFRMPGKAAEAKGFTKDREGRLRFIFDGKEAARHIEKFLEGDMADLSEFIGEMKVGDLQSSLDPMLVNRLLGTGLTGRAVVKLADEPLFDYEAEVRKAKADQDAMMKKLREQAARE